MKKIFEKVEYKIIFEYIKKAKNNIIKIHLLIN
jgi:hypothetical protein